MGQYQFERCSNLEIRTENGHSLIIYFIYFFFFNFSGIAPALQYIYSVAFMWYPIIGVVLALLVGIIVSFLTGR